VEIGLKGYSISYVAEMRCRHWPIVGHVTSPERVDELIVMAAVILVCL